MVYIVTVENNYMNKDLIKRVYTSKKKALDYAYFCESIRDAYDTIRVLVYNGNTGTLANTIEISDA